MKIRRLTGRPDGTVAATLIGSDGRETDVTFAVTHAGGIAVASPDQPVFDQARVDAEDVRAVIGAILAFDAVAAYVADGHE